MALGAVRGIWFGRNPIGAIRMGLGTPIGVIGGVGAGKFVTRVGW
ncbi:hypothetical protein [Helicobacter apodemus]|nr:hypothetical protein [Helicobacter apodemus]